MCQKGCISCVNSSKGELHHINILTRSAFLLLLFLIQEKYAISELPASVLFRDSNILFNTININMTDFIINI